VVKGAHARRRQVGPGVVHGRHADGRLSGDRPKWTRRGSAVWISMGVPVHLPHRLDDRIRAGCVVGFMSSVRPISRLTLIRTRSFTSFPACTGSWTCRTWPPSPRRGRCRSSSAGATAFSPLPGWKSRSAGSRDVSGRRCPEKFDGRFYDSRTASRWRCRRGVRRGWTNT